MARSRAFATRWPVRLGDCGPDGRLRPDGLVRYLQDVASDDWIDTGLPPGPTWLVRHATVRLTPGARWPELGDEVTLTTWCSGTGAAWAERRTDIEVRGECRLETATLWVSVGPSGRPLRLAADFFAAYGESAQRKVSGRVSLAPPPPDAERRPWPLRRSDLDVVGHVNNAALWSPLVELASAPLTFARVIHHAPVAGDDAPELLVAGTRWWLTVQQLVHVEGVYALGG
ncbi:MAG: acyl-[acyl-carrier-protein] thioesterase [Acidimicrobiales bacterium]